MIAAAILTAEVAFWLLLLGGLTARYALDRSPLGAALLIGVPLVDAALLAATALHLAGGAPGRLEPRPGGPLPRRERGLRAVARARRRPPLRRRPVAGLVAVGRRSPWRGTGGCGCAAPWPAASPPPCSERSCSSAAPPTPAPWAGGAWFAQIALILGVWFLFGPVWTAVARHVPHPASARAAENPR